MYQQPPSIIRKSENSTSRAPKNTKIPFDMEIRCVISFDVHAKMKHKTSLFHLVIDWIIGLIEFFSIWIWIIGLIEFFSDFVLEKNLDGSNPIW